MGIEYYTARFLLEGARSGANFGRVLTIGRQNLFVSPHRLRRLGREFQFDGAAITRETEGNGGYAEPFFSQALGSESVTSLDASCYEQASVVHDLNQPLPEELKQRFSAVVEAGSLEHIFNFPTAIQNLMEAVEVGGDLFIQTPANNYFGHGFYQFSPELYFRVLSPENGFEIKRCLIFEHIFPAWFPKTSLYSVKDPAVVGGRVQLISKRPVLMLIQARRVSSVKLFSKTPQQSDYQAAWDQQTQPSPGALVPRGWRGVLIRLVDNLPLWLIGWYWLQRRFKRPFQPSQKNRRFFKKVMPGGSE